MTTYGVIIISAQNCAFHGGVGINQKIQNRVDYLLDDEQKIEMYVYHAFSEISITFLLL